MKRLLLSFMVMGMIFISGCFHPPLWIIPVSSVPFFVGNIYYGIKDAKEDKKKEIQRLKMDIPIIDEEEYKNASPE